MRYSWPLTGRVEEVPVIETAISDPDVAGIVICGCAARAEMLAQQCAGARTPALQPDSPPPQMP
jgi:hypothetical protein